MHTLVYKDAQTSVYREEKNPKIIKGKRIVKFFAN